MKSILKTILYGIIIFGILPMGLETLRWWNIESSMNEDIEGFILDSIELSMEDKYRHDHISIIDPNDCEEILKRSIKDNYRLDNTFIPEGNHYLVDKFVITQLDVTKGKFDYDRNGNPRQIQKPSVKIVAKTYIKPFMYGADKNIPVNINLYIENKRMD